MGYSQITINKSFYKKMEALENRVKHDVFTKGQEIVSYAVSISPVDTGAYVESFSVVGRGAGGGRSRSSENRRRLGTSEKEGVKMDEAARLRAELEAIDLTDEKGFTLRNRAPHNKAVEDKHAVFLRTKDRFR
jgi:hypothetical protein